LLKQTLLTQLDKSNSKKYVVSQEEISIEHTMFRSTHFDAISIFQKTRISFSVI